ncbi:MAG: transposase, partial [Thermomicrobiales bacterium]
PQAVRRQRERRLRREASKKRQTLRAERLALAGWTVLVTNLPRERLTLAEAPALLRVRWQIELLFKLWKQDGQLASWRSAKPWRILCEVYAKLIGLLIQHWLMVMAGWAAPDHSLVAAGQVVRQHVIMLAHTLEDPRRLRDTLDAIRRCLPHAGRLNPRRTHPTPTNGSSIRRAHVPHRQACLDAYGSLQDRPLHGTSSISSEFPLFLDPEGRAT